MALSSFQFIYMTIYMYSRISLVFLQNLATTLNTVSPKDPIVWCKFQPNGYDCKGNGRVFEKYYFDTKLEDCKLFDYGSCDDDPNKFSSLVDCRESCLEAGVGNIFGNVSAEVYCKLQPEFGLCNDYNPMFYFDISTRTCKGFSFSGCGGNLNRFHSPHECGSICARYSEKDFQE